MNSESLASAWEVTRTLMLTTLNIALARSDWAEAETKLNDAQAAVANSNSHYLQAQIELWLVELEMHRAILKRQRRFWIKFKRG